MRLFLPAGHGMAWVTPLPWSRGLPKSPDPKAAMGWKLCVLSSAVFPLLCTIFGKIRREKVWDNVSLWDPSQQIL